MKQIDRDGMLLWKNRIPLLSAGVLLFASLPFLARSPWYDEVLTLSWLQLDFNAIPFTYPIPNNHIVYTILLWLWSQLTGMFSSSWLFFMRIFSLIGGMTAIYLVSRRVVLHSGLIPGICCSLLLAVSGTMSLFSTALRGYVFALLFSFAAFLFAERWLGKGLKKGVAYGVIYFIFCCLSVGVMPTNLFVLGAGAIFFLPLILQSKEKFCHVLLIGLLPVVALFVSYAHIFGQLLNASRLREGWDGYASAYWNLYGTFLFVFFPIIVPAVMGAIDLWRHEPKLRFRLCCFAVIFLMPLILSVLAQVPPFPRIFFPFFGLWTVILGFLLIPFSRCFRIGKWYVIPLFAVLLWAILASSITPHLSKILFGGPRTDDLLHPYPVSSVFSPQETAEVIRKHLNGSGSVFLDFNADPPSLAIALLSCDVPDSAILYDRPDRGKVMELSPDALIVCSDSSSLAAVLARFHLTGEYRCIFAKGMQKVYQKK